MRKKSKFTIDNENSTSYNFFDNGEVLGPSAAVYGIDGYTAPSPYLGQLFLVDMFSNGQRQLYFGATWTVYSPTNGGPINYPTNFNAISDYSSSYDDGFPCIDLITHKVYFSSKRYGRGYWSLYRFNIKTFDKELHYDTGSTNANLFNGG